MNRTLGIAVLTSALLAACGGGGIQSPDFEPVLTGFIITTPAESTPPAANAPITVAPSRTLQLAAQGLYSTPPGTRSGTGIVPCTDLNGRDSLCTLGAVAGVTFSVDPPTNQTLATVTSSGLLTGVRRGTTIVRARLAPFTEVARPLTVDGPVLTFITITARDVKNNRALPTNGMPVSDNNPATVPVGRTVQLTATATCQSGINTPTTVPCTNLNYGFNWALPLAAPSSTVDFTPNPPVGQIIAVKTKVFGPFQIFARLTNEEGDPIETSIPLSASERVLDDIVVVADPVQPSPVSVAKGTVTRFIAKGVFSNGVTDDLREIDLSANRPSPVPSGTRCGQRLTWRQDTSFVGGPITIQDPAGVDDPNTSVCEAGDFNNAVIVSVNETANNPATIGPNGLTATGFNTEQIPVPASSATAPLTVEDRIAIRVDDLNLLAVTSICPRALASDIGSVCRTNTQIPMGDIVKYVARGTFQGDPVGTQRDIDPQFIPIQFQPGNPASDALIDVNVDSADQDTADGLDIGAPGGDAQAIDFDDVGQVRGVAQGVAQLVASLPNGFAPNISDRDESIDVTVVEQQCRDQFLVGNGTTAANDNGDLIGLSSADNPGNVIDTNPANFGTFSVGPSILGGSIAMEFRRDGTLITPVGTRTLGFVFNHADDEFVPADSVTIETLNQTGGVVQNLGQPTVSSFAARGGDFRLYTAQPTLPFSGVRITVDVPLLAGILPSVDLPAYLMTLLNGGTLEGRIYSACADITP